MVKILLIDDEETNDLIFSHIIGENEVVESYHYENNGWAALHFLASCENNGNTFPDIIFVDLNMPEMHGFDFIEFYEKKFFHTHSKTKVVVLTSSDLNKDKEKAHQFSSVSAFINKAKGEEMVLDTIQGYENNMAR